jgi:hypothetical protein
MHNLIFKTFIIQMSTDNVALLRIPYIQEAFTDQFKIKIRSRIAQSA